MGPDTLSKREIVSGLANIGLRRNENVVVHTKLSSFGHVNGGADTVIDALQDTVTSTGTIVMPTYSGELIYFLESLALSAGVNGRGGTGTGTVFDGAGAALWRKLRKISESSAIAYPFTTVEQMVKRIQAEKPRILERNGWTVEVLQKKPAQSRVRLARDAKALLKKDLKPWRMPAWTGAVPDAFWRRHGVIRSHQYSGSFAAWGRMADWVLAKHDNTPGQTMEDHPLYRMMEIEGKVLLLGVDHAANSTIHVAQWAAFRDSPIKLPESQREFLASFHLVESVLDSMHAQTKGRIGAARVRLVDTRGLFKAVALLLAEKTAGELEPQADGS